jgi:hypothetical protein
MRNVLFALAALCFVFVPADGQEGRLLVKQNAADPSRQDCDVTIATFTTPKNWQAHPSDKNTYALLTRASEQHPNLTSMITIDLGKPKLPTAKASADDFAKEWKGRVDEKPLKLDGEVAYRVTIPPDGKTLRPVECVVAYRAGRLVLVIGGTNEMAGVHAEIEEVVGTWKWKAAK